jgi:hypothetical protein
MFGLFSEPVRSTVLAPLGQKMGLLNQFSLAYILLSLNIDIKAPDCFSREVYDTFDGPGGASAVAKVALSLSLLNIITICAKIVALSKANPGLMNVLMSKSDTFSSALDKIDTQMSGQSDAMRAIFGVRNNPNLRTLCDKYGIPNIPCLIDFALLVHISLICNQVFKQILLELVPALAVLLAAVIQIVVDVLCLVAVLLESILIAILGLLGGILYSVLAIVKSLLIPTCWDVISLCFPELTGVLSQGVASQWSPFPQSTYICPGPYFYCARNCYDLLNCV